MRSRWMVVLGLMLVLAVPGGALAGPMDGAKMSGYVDIYANYNTNNPVNNGNQLRAFDGNADTVALNLVKMVWEKAASKKDWGWRLDLAYGPAAAAIAPTAAGVDMLVYQGYLSMIYNDMLSVDVGKFATHMGAEVTESKDNLNYSNGLLYNFAIPIYHAGIRTNWKWNNQWSSMISLTNGWNNLADNNRAKTWGASVAYTPNAMWGVTVNWLGGASELAPAAGAGARNVFDTVAWIQPNSAWLFKVNWDAGSQTNGAGSVWSGIAAYAAYAWSKDTTLAFRWENYQDPQGATTGAVQGISSYTLTASKQVSPTAWMRYEVRHDNSSATPFVGDGVTARGSQTTGTVAFVQTF